jgi:hypothetical protein
MGAIEKSGSGPLGFDSSGNYFPVGYYSSGSYWIESC